MRAVQRYMADAASPATLVEVSEPELAGGAGARVALSTGGIGGSDLHHLTHSPAPSPTRP